MRDLQDRCSEAEGLFNSLMLLNLILKREIGINNADWATVCDYAQKVMSDKDVFDRVGPAQPEYGEEEEALE